MKYIIRIKEHIKYLGHRGANGDYPGNTMGGFKFGSEMRVDGFETDVRKTGDGILVLANKPTTHEIIDENYRDTKNEPGFKEEYEKAMAQPDYRIDQEPYNLLSKYDFGKGEPIVKLEDFLSEYGNSGKYIAIELKQHDIAADTISLIKKYVKDLSKITITSFDYSTLQEVRACDKDIRIGWLTHECSEKEFLMLKAINGQQICPRVIINDDTEINGKIYSALTPEKVKAAKENGFEVRAWGIFSEELLEHARKCNVDGMTINYPQKHKWLLRGIELKDDGRIARSKPRPRHHKNYESHDVPEDR